jgi:hypothetical protein
MMNNCKEGECRVPDKDQEEKESEGSIFAKL